MTDPERSRNVPEVVEIDSYNILELEISARKMIARMSARAHSTTERSTNTGAQQIFPQGLDSEETDSNQLAELFYATAASLREGNTVEIQYDHPDPESGQTSHVVVVPPRTRPRSIGISQVLDGSELQVLLGGLFPETPTIARPTKIGDVRPTNLETRGRINTALAEGRSIQLKPLHSQPRPPRG